MNQQPPENSGPTLKDIGYFRITSRDLKRYEKELGFKAEQLKQDSLILDIGSGFNQELPQQLRVKRPDINVISVDPSLALPTSQAILDKLGIRYVIQPSSDEAIRVTKEADRKLRLSNTQPDTLAAIAPHLPFKDNSFDYVFDNHGAFMYSDSTNRLLKYLNEIVRVLKSRGTAVIFPLDLKTEENLSAAAKYQISIARINMLLKAAKIEHYEMYDCIEHAGYSSYKRAGIKIFKD